MKAWRMHRTADGVRFVDYTCPSCRAELNWEINDSGVAPVARCCSRALPYPIDDPAFARHLVRGATEREVATSGDPWRVWRCR
jgi:hypothetical protein